MEARRILVDCDFTYVAEISTPVIFQSPWLRRFGGPLLEPMVVQAEEATG
jgi:hypothetical protein